MNMITSINDHNISNKKVGRMKNRVLFIMHMPPPVHGAAMMGQYIHDSKLINESFECRYINESSSRTIDEVGGKYFKKVFRFIGHLFDILRTVRSFKPNLVYVTPSGYNPELGFLKYVLEFSILNAFGCKKLIHFHNKGEKEKSEQWYIRWYYRFLFKNADVIFLSKLLVPQFHYYLHESQIHICPNGIKESLEEEPVAERKNTMSKLLFLSNMMAEKGVFVLLDAISILKNRGIMLSCDFVGGWKDISQESFKDYCRKKDIEEMITAHGPKYGSDKLTYFMNADVFVFPTFYSGETFGLVNLEAMENKLPVVSTNVGGIPDVVVNDINGYVCNPKDSTDLADKIEILLKDKQLRERMGEAGYRMFKEKFTISSFEKRMHGIIVDVLGKKENYNNN